MDKWKQLPWKPRCCCGIGDGEPEKLIRYTVFLHVQEEQRSNKFITLLVMLVPLMLNEPNRNHKFDKFYSPDSVKSVQMGVICHTIILMTIALSNLFHISVYLNRQKICTFLW